MLMGRSIQVHRLLYEAPLPLNSYGQLSGKYGRVTSYVCVGGVHITLYFIYYVIFYVSLHIPLSLGTLALRNSHSQKPQQL